MTQLAKACRWLMLAGLLTASGGMLVACDDPNGGDGAPPPAQPAPPAQ
jgi:ribulose-5-phosphate 4-epimerase/fuculose-1-phosphate aldolase